MKTTPQYSLIHQRSVPIVTGGYLTFSLTGNFLELNADERSLLAGVIDLVEAYSKAHPSATNVLLNIGVESTPGTAAEPPKEASDEH